MILDYLKKWTLPRGIQLFAGVMFLNSYFTEGGQVALAFGAVMFFQAVLNVGCFSTRGCSTSIPDTQEDIAIDEIEVEYEEIERPQKTDLHV